MHVMVWYGMVWTVMVRHVTARHISTIYEWEIHKGTLEKKLNKSYSHFSAGLLK
jgi:hypothetical protein